MQVVERIVKMKRGQIAVLLMCAALLMAGCKARHGVGGEAAAGTGAVAGAPQKGKDVDATTGATVGGDVGASIATVMDHQKKEIEDAALPGVSVEAVRGGEALMVTIGTDDLFAANSSVLKAASRTALTKLSDILAERADIDAKIVCHTDSTGKEEYNLILSSKRAKSICLRMKEYGVGEQRMSCEGKGSANPKAGNDTPEGRDQNRRVEILLFAGKGMLRAAQEGTLK